MGTLAAWWVVVCVMWGMGWKSAVAQVAEAKPCVHLHQTGSARVRGYVFIAYEGQMDDPACLRVYRDGKVVYQMAIDTVQRYELGQPRNSEYNVPHVVNGADLTGRGRPDMIVTSWSGGAHCCFVHYIFELEPKLQLISKMEDGDTDLSHFELMDGGHGYEYMTSEIWSYWPASFASSISHEVLMRWDGKAFVWDWDRMKRPAPTPERWAAELKAIDDAVKSDGDRGSVGQAIWNPVLNLIYTGHFDLAWKFVAEANPEARHGKYASLEEFCSMVGRTQYWEDFKPKLSDVPQECAKGVAAPDRR